MSETIEYLTPREIAAMLRISISKATALVRDKLPHLNVSTGKRATYRVPIQAYRDFVAGITKQREENPPKKPVPLPKGVKRFV